MPLILITALQTNSTTAFQAIYLFLFGKIVFVMVLKGFLQQLHKAQHVLVTTERVPITAPSPIFMPGIIIASAPIQTSLPITVSPAFL